MSDQEEQVIDYVCNDDSVADPELIKTVMNYVGSFKGTLRKDLPENRREALLALILLRG